MLLVSCHASTAETSAPIVVAPEDAGSSAKWFDEIASAAGLSFTRVPSEYATLQGRMAGGVCLLDVDGNGAIDLFFPGSISAGGSGSHLYVAHPGAVKLRYLDEAAARGVDRTGDGGGCLAVDLDGDGRSELLTTGLGGAHLFRDDGSGKFTDVSDRLPKVFAADQFLTSAVAFDADGDGDLDLGIATYGKFKHPAAGTKCIGPCEADISQYDFGAPSLFLQGNDGVFADASDRLPRLKEPGLVLLATDLDEDSKIDLFLGNDVASFPDHYYRGDGMGGFTDVGAELGVRFAASKSGISSMSSNDPDFDGDGHLDLFESSQALDPDGAFRCGVPGGGCVDISDSLELFRAKENYRWGQATVDFDDDGVDELLEGVGSIQTGGDDDTGILWPTRDTPYFWHRESNRGALVLQPSTGALAAETAGRGVVAADLDGDGDLDVVVGTAQGRPLLLENVRAPRGHALNIVLAGAGKNSRGIGARITVHVGARVMPAIVHAGSSWMSSDDGRTHFALGAATSADSIEVRWPSGKVTNLGSTPADVPLTVRE